MIELPTATDSITNKQSSEKASLYHTCRSVLNGLTSVRGFDSYLETDTSSTCLTLPNGDDPLTRLWNICRQGSSLCYLFNMLRPDTPIEQKKSQSSSANKSKACVYHFIVACKEQLQFSEDELFTVTDLYQNDTNGFVKVVNTVKRILDLLEQEGIISVTSLEINDVNTPKDMRGNVVFELLSTERKYVQDLEALQNYMREVQAQEILSQDTMHYLFGNLNALVDFQRRFLIQLEGQGTNPPQEQRFGSLFIQFEEAFAVYEPFCANFQIAQDLVVQVAPKLQKLNHIMSPTYELPAMLIKPIQRVCKYPLLLQQLVKATPEDYMYYEQDKVGIEAIQRVTKSVNETKRVQENILIVQDLKKRICMDDNWKESIENFGTLLLHDRFIFIKPDNTEREMLVYLFKKACIICKEIKESNSISIKKKRKEGSLVVREKIIISRIEHVKGTGQNGQYILNVTSVQPDSVDKKTVSLKCRNDEQLKQWLTSILELTEAGIESGNETPTKLDALPLAPQTPRYSSLPDEDQSPFFLHYDQDGTLMVDDDEPLGYTRTRSYSYQHAQRPAGEFTAGRKAMSQHHGLSVPGSRHFNGGMPGINLPPLPRSPSHISHTNDTLPSSPPSSIPPSPTATQSSNRGIAPSGSLWQRRQTNESEPITPPFQHIRARSQSTPNIQRPSQQHIPELPNTVQEEEYEEPRYEEDQMVPPVVSKIIKLKVHYYGAIYVVVVPVQIEFEELLRRIESKIKIAQESHKTVLGLKYEDEDGDLITISSNEDVQMGFESKGNANHVSLYVT